MKAFLWNLFIMEIGFGVFDIFCFLILQTSAAPDAEGIILPTETRFVI